jgi:transposase
VVTRINRRGGACPCTDRRIVAPVSQRFEADSPFGPGVCALILHLHITQAISLERLARLMSEVFGLTISEGAIANILARLQTPLVVAGAPIAQAVWGSLVVGCDETWARVHGPRWWQWVLLTPNRGVPRQSPIRGWPRW